MRLIKILAAIETIIISIMLFLCNTQNVKAEIQSEQQNSVKVGVLLYRFDDAYISQDASAMAEACYAIGINLFNGRSPLDGTKYMPDETGVAIRTI